MERQQIERNNYRSLPASVNVNASALLLLQYWCHLDCLVCDYNVHDDGPLVSVNVNDDEDGGHLTSWWLR